MALQETLNKPMADPFGVASKTRAAEQAKADMGVELAQKQEQEMKPILEAERQKMDEVGARQAQIGQQMEKPFEIPKETMGDFAQLAGLVAIAGTMLGSSGKQSANNVLGAMTGIMEGYKSGRKEVVANSYKEFDTNMKRLQGLQKQIDSELTLYLQKSATNREEAKTHLATAKALAGQGIAGTIADGQSADKVAQLQMQLKQMGQSAQQHQERIDMEKKRYEAEQENKKITPAYTGPDGTVYNAKGEVIPVPKGLTKFGAAGKTGAGDRFGFGNIVSTNINEAVGSIGNIVNLPFNVSTGAFQGRNTTGLLNAPLGALTNKLTKEDVQRYNTEISNFGKFASRVVSGGRVVPASVQKDFEEQYKIREGDKPLTVLTKLAMMRQTLERAAEVYMADPNTGAQTKEIYQRGLEDIRTSIPFTVNEINQFAKQRDGKTTFTEMFPDYGLGNQSSQVLSFSTEAEAEDAARKGTLKSGQKVKIGGKSGTWE